MEQYKVSVITPVYNIVRGGVEEYFKKLANIILQNSYRNIEWILIDDGSTDSTISICNEVASSDSRVKVICQSNCGASSARNRGIDASTGDYIHICDADDELETEIYTVAMSVAEKYVPDVIRFNIKTYHSDMSCQNSLVDHPYDILLGRQYIVEEVIPYLIGIKVNPKKKMDGHWSLLTKASIIKDNSIRYNELQTKEEDHPFMVNIMAYAQTMYFLPGTYYHYIKHKGSLISRFSNRFKNICDNFRLYEQLFGNLYNFNSQEKIRYNINVLIECLDYMFIHYKDCKSKQEVIAILSSVESKNWFSMLQPNSRYVAVLKRCVTAQRFYSAYLCALVHYLLFRAGNLKRMIVRKLISFKN